MKCEEKSALIPWSRAEYEDSEERTGDDLEDARRFLIRCWQAHGARFHSRSGWSRSGPIQVSVLPRWQRLPERLQAVVGGLKAAEIERRPATQLIADSNYWTPASSSTSTRHICSRRATSATTSTR